MRRRFPRRSGRMVSSSSLFRGFTKLEICIIGTIVILLVVLIAPNVFEARHHKEMTKRMHAQRAMATALESYHLDHHAYPSMVLLSSHPNVDLRRLEEDGGSKVTAVGSAVYYYLDRPIWRDWYSPRKEDRPFVYFTDGEGWMLLSMGPDGDYDMDPAKSYDSSIPQPSPALLLSGTYDPSNGATSSGDVWRVKE